MSDDHASPGPQDTQPVQSREVRVDEPQLSPEANRRLTEQVQAVVEADQVRVPADRPRPSRGERVSSGGTRAVLSTNRPLLVITFIAAVVVGAILTLTTGSWWFLPLAVIVHALGTMVVVGYVIRLTNIHERPEPSTVAMLEEEGVRNPEQHFSDLVDEFTEPTDQHDSGRRTEEAHERPARAAAEQRSAITPTSGPSEPVGPGD
jgi:hypothetical protein